MSSAYTLHPDELRPCPECAADLGAELHDAAHGIWEWNRGIFAAARGGPTTADEIAADRERRRDARKQGTNTRW